jgi:hypothetical protein
MCGLMVPHSVALEIPTIHAAFNAENHLMNKLNNPLNLHVSSCFPNVLEHHLYKLHNSLMQINTKTKRKK